MMIMVSHLSLRDLSIRQMDSPRAKLMNFSEKRNKKKGAQLGSLFFIVLILYQVLVVVRNGYCSVLYQ